MDYKELFLEFMKTMDSEFNWTIDFDKELIKRLIVEELGEEHELYNKNIIPIALCKNKYDLLAYYKENDVDVFITIHFRGYKSNVENTPYFEKYIQFGDALNQIRIVYEKLYKNSRYDMLIESEQTKQIKSHQTLKGLYNIMPIIYDTLFKMNEFRGQVVGTDEQDLLTIQDLFQFFSYEFPYKIRSIFLLTEIGNYGDAAILLRSLIETFFYYKYFLIKKDGKKLSEYVMQDKKSTIRIKDIMEYIAPTYYDTVYDNLCKFTHGDPFITGVFRGNVSKKDVLLHNMYNINIGWFSYILNNCLPIIKGYFNMFGKIYRNNTINTSKQLMNNISIIEEFIDRDMNSRFNQYEKQRPTIELYKKIISFE